jgi:hypothetical protein
MDLGLRARRSAPVVVSEPRTSSLLSVAERKEEFYSHATEKKRKGNA